MQHSRNTSWTGRAEADNDDRMQRGDNNKEPDDRLGTVDLVIRKKKIFTALAKMPEGAQKVLLENGWIGKTSGDNSGNSESPLSYHQGWTKDDGACSVYAETPRNKRPKHNGLWSEEWEMWWKIRRIVFSTFAPQHANPRTAVLS